MHTKKTDRNSIMIIIAAVAVIPSIWAVMHFGGIIFTYTGSVPVGFYRIEQGAQKVSSGDYCPFVCLNA